jgi:nucleoside-diphosphate-sugar epimerase
MKVLITGSLGFIGQTLEEYLKSLGYEVFGLDKLTSDKANFKSVDILNYNDLYLYLNEVQPEIIVHLAARIDISNDSVDKYLPNITGVANMVRATEQITSIKRVIWTSSQAVNRLGLIDSETQTYYPNTSYGESKVIGELLVKNGVSNKEWVIIRPTNVWGPNMCEHYRNFISYINKRKYFHVTLKEVKKSYSYIGNICFQIEKLVSAESKRVDKKVFYLCDYESIEVKDWANKFAKYLGKAKPISLPYFLTFTLAQSCELLYRLKIIKSRPLTAYTLKNIMTDYKVNNQELHEITGDLPYNVETGIMLTVKWFNNI